ncbi:MAG: transglutaminase-like domain-containing protein [Planctomycetota bacterium]
MAKIRLVFLIMAWAVFPTVNAWSQFGTPLNFNAEESEEERERTQRWRTGVRVSARGAPCFGVHGTFSVPVDWPEQDVKVVEENISDVVNRTRYRNLEHGVRQMWFMIRRLDGGEQAEVTVTFEITRRTKPIPDDTTGYRIPESIPREARQWLMPSPKINCRSGRIRTKAKEIIADKETAWEQVAAIHDWVKENIRHTNESLKGAVDTLEKKTGNHEDLAGLFIALCRASEVPARTVWVPGYCHAEFYLQDKEGNGTWFPCEFKEKTEFGTVSQPYLILQKGDNIRVPEIKTPQRFVPEYLNVKTGRKPSVTFVRDTLGIK